MFLSEDEVRALTKRKQRRAQVRALRAMGIDHKTRPDGSPVVLRSHVESELGHDVKGKPAAKEWSIDLDTID